jgi:curved DNA-binding protein CbpA
MRTLYDLIGARPEDDAERLRSAFRQAAKASHPDLHAGDPDASMRFRRIVAAYDVLRHAEQKATYDRLLQFQREQFQSQSKRIISHLMHSIVSDAIAVVGLAIVLAGGYTLFAYISKVPGEVKVAEDTATAPTRVAAIQPAAQTETSDRGEIRSNLGHFEFADMPILSNAAAPQANSGRALAHGDAGQAWSPAGLSTEIAKINSAFDAPIDQADAGTTGRRDKNYGEPPDQGKARSSSVRISLREKDDAVSKSSLSEFTMSGQKHDLKVPDTPDINTRDMKIPAETKMPGKQRTIAKRQAPNQAPLRQVSLENKETSACSGAQSCSGNVPPLFGVGF